MRAAFALLALLPLACAAQAPDFSRLVREQSPAVVTIAAAFATPPVIPDVPHEEPIYSLLERAATGMVPGFDIPPLGSGFIISADGDILTSHHIVEEAFNGEVIVRLADGRELLGKVAGGDWASDIALVRIRASDLPVARIGDPARLQPGEWAVAVGAPYGFRHSISAGVISSTSRTLPTESRYRFIQTDTATNPGHSGGPLFNLAGEVVGVNSRIFSPDGGSIGLSFAVPIDLAMKVADQLRAGSLPRGRLGLSVQEVNGELARAFGLQRAGGALVTTVEPRGPAERAGIRPGDVITALSGFPVQAYTELLELVAALPPDTAVAIELVRGGRAERVNARSAPSGVDYELRSDVGGTDRLGFSLAPLGEAQRRRLAVPGGAVVQRSEGAARLSGIYSGDILLAVNGLPVRSQQELLAMLSRARSGDTVALLVDRMGSRAFVPLRVP